MYPNVTYVCISCIHDTTCRNGFVVYTCINSCIYLFLGNMATLQWLQLFHSACTHDAGGGDALPPPRREESEGNSAVSTTSSNLWEQQQFLRIFVALYRREVVILWNWNRTMTRIIDIRSIDFVLFWTMSIQGVHYQAKNRELERSVQGKWAYVANDRQWVTQRCTHYTQYIHSIHLDTKSYTWLVDQLAMLFAQCCQARSEGGREIALDPQNFSRGSPHGVPCVKCS